MSLSSLPIECGLSFSHAGNTTCAGNKGTTIQQQTNRITASYLQLQKTENIHNPDIQNYQKNRLVKSRIADVHSAHQS